MTKSEKIVTAVILIFAAIIIVPIGYLVGETTGALIAAGIMAVAFLLTAGLFENYVVLNEMEVGVVFDRHGNFVCFLDNDYGRIARRYDKESEVWYGDTNGDGIDDIPLPRPLPKPLARHQINRATEVLKSRLRKGSFEASGTAKDVRTREGIPINIPWVISFRIEVWRIKPGIDYKLARGLPDNADKMVGGRMLQILQHVVGQKSIQDLYAAPGNNSAIQLLEDEVRTQLLSRARAIGITGIAGNDLKIGPIELPGKIETTLRDAHQRLLYADTLANALQRLQQAVHAFSPDDLERLTELERLRIIDEKTQSLVLSESFVSARKQKNINFYEEGGQSNGNGYQEPSDDL
ncbi:MAG TPA: SPFH domain-containing protein [Chloroflexota bacterium]|nr:SPFH domain-containing protein [Chloroflexota bacterium]HUM69826.1 SPFH domain-containing protein [Chloroflexota bacterium]